MARRRRTPEDLRSLADTAEEIAQKLRETADRIEQVGASSVLTHGDIFFNTYFPKAQDWAIKLLGEFEAEYRAASQGKMSQAEYNVRKNQRGGVNAPNSELDSAPPEKKKTTKKRPPKK